MKKVKNFLLLFDIFSTPYNFRYENSNSFNSLYGTAIGIFFGVVIIVLGFLFGEEVFERKQPTTYKTTILRENVKNHLKNLTMIFFISDKKVTTNTYPIYDYLEVVGSTQYILENQTNIIENSFELNRCNISDLNYYNQLDVIDNSNVYIYCLNFKENYDYVVNDIDSMNSVYQFLEFYKCNKTQRTCAENLDEKYESLALYFSFIETILNPIKKDQKEIFVSKDKTNFMFINSNTVKDSSVKIVRNEFISDEGYFTDKYEYFDYFSIEKTDTEFSLITGEHTLPNIILKIGSSTIVSQTFRKYMKVQDLLARIGGVTSSLLFILNIISSNFIEFNYTNHIFELIIDNHFKLKEAKKSKFSDINFQTDKNLPFINLKDSNLKSLAHSMNKDYCINSNLYNSNDLILRENCHNNKMADVIPTCKNEDNEKKDYNCFKFQKEFLKYNTFNFENFNSEIITKGLNNEELIKSKTQKGRKNLENLIKENGKENIERKREENHYNSFSYSNNENEEKNYDNQIKEEETKKKERKVEFFTKNIENYKDEKEYVEFDAKTQKEINNSLKQFHFSDSQTSNPEEGKEAEFLRLLDNLQHESLYNFPYDDLILILSSSNKKETEGEKDNDGVLSLKKINSKIESKQNVSKLTKINYFHYVFSNIFCTKNKKKFMIKKYFLEKTLGIESFIKNFFITEEEKLKNM